MEDDKEVLKEFVEEPPETVGAPPSTLRKKRSSRIYFGIVTFGMFMFLLLCAIALGSFGEVQRQLSRFYTEAEKVILGNNNLCILSVNGEARNIRFGSYSPCIFIFWGLVSGIILALALFLYSLVMLIIGPRILSWPRLLDSILCFVGFLGFFAYSITLTAGLNKTCSIKGGPCSTNYLTRKADPDVMLYFYTAVATAQNCSWIVTIALFIFSIWNFILMIFYFKQKRRRGVTINERSEFKVVTFPSAPLEQPPPYSDPPQDQLLEDGASPFSGQANPYTQQDQLLEDGASPFSGQANPYTQQDQSLEDEASPFSGQANPYTQQDH